MFWKKKKKNLLQTYGTEDTGMKKDKATAKGATNDERQRILQFMKQFPGLDEKSLKGYTFLGRFDKIKDDLNPSESLLINMELRNGFHQTFMIQHSEPFFHFQGGTYIIDASLKYYNISSRLYMLDYHQDFCMPVKREWNIDRLKKAIKFSNITEIDLAINPMNVESFIEGKVVEGMVRGQQIVEELKKYFLLLIINALFSGIHLVLFVVKTGMLNGVKIPGFG